MCGGVSGLMDGAAAPGLYLFLRADRVFSYSPSVKAAMKMARTER